MNNVWNTIPLEDYEKHMQHETVGQLQLLNKLTMNYLKLIHPKTIIFLGIAGGNGLEHIDSSITPYVFGIDINKKYLEETQKRFKDQLPNLKLFNLDISSSKNKMTIARADLIWAALIFEYLEIKNCFEFIRNNIHDNGHLIVTIQSNNGAGSVSQTGIETIKSVGQIFRLIDENELLSFADKFGFVKTDFEENILPNKKSLKTYVFIKQRISGTPK